jgi:aerobic carbon-monoxide dehydrogenase small subunit
VLERPMLERQVSGRQVSERQIELTVNGERRSISVEDRMTLADALRDRCQLTGTHLACEHGVCGACTVLLDGEAVRSCLMFAVQAVDADVTTVEGLTPTDGTLSVVQEAFRDSHGLQCGFCTPGFIVSLTAFLSDFPDPSDDELRDALTGNLCRCTGYQGILKAARLAAARSRAGTGTAPTNGARNGMTTQLEGQE